MHDIYLLLFDFLDNIETQWNWWWFHHENLICDILEIWNAFMYISNRDQKNNNNNCKWELAQRCFVITKPWNPKSPLTTDEKFNQIRSTHTWHEVKIGKTCAKCEAKVIIVVHFAVGDYGPNAWESVIRHVACVCVWN